MDSVFFSRMVLLILPFERLFFGLLIMINGLCVILMEDNLLPNSTGIIGLWETLVKQLWARSWIIGLMNCQALVHYHGPLLPSTSTLPWPIGRKAKVGSFYWWAFLSFFVKINRISWSQSFSFLTSCRNLGFLLIIMFIISFNLCDNFKEYKISFFVHGNILGESLPQVH